MKIYLHGLGQTSADWTKTIGKIGDAENSVCLDLTKINCKEKVTYRGLYAAISDELSRYDEPITLCGLSLGGVMALNYTIDNPYRVGALVLIAAQYKMPKFMLKFQNLIFRIMPETAFQQMGFSKRDTISLCNTMSELDFSDALDKIACPTLIICGEKDSANRKASEKLAEKIKNAKLTIVGKAGHEINIDAPEKLAEILQEFYRSL